MKVQLLAIHLIFLSFSVINPTYAQTWCLDLPSTKEDIEACNRGIARAFAPILNQYSQVAHSHSVSGHADRILKLNYDTNSDGTDNWVATDNWDNLVNVGDPSHSQYDVRPHAYYAVTWTDQVWIIVYTFYYARDYADEGLGCIEDEHEGDMVKIFVVAKRPDSENQLPQEMLLGFQTSLNSTTCPTENGVTIIKSFQNSTTALGVHPIVFSAAGSHHYYLSSNDAQFDEHHKFENEHCIIIGSELISYTPPEDDADITSTLTTFTTAPFPKAYYGLIDIYDEDEGLWEQRTNHDLFTDEPLDKQRLPCNNGGGCQNWPVGDKAPWAPWTGSWGINPLEEIYNGFNNFNCNCSNSLEGCQGLTITGCIYEYNPYMCEFYSIETPSHFDYRGLWVENPLEFDDDADGNLDLVVVFTFSAFDGFTGTPSNIDWNWTVPFGTMVDCSGCNDNPANRITLTLYNTTKDDVKNNPSGYKISASADFIECGTITKENSFQKAIANFINPSSGCDRLVLQVNDSFHVNGNQYDWSFPLYDGLATITDGGRRVEFDTEAVLQQTTEATNPDSVLAYHLKVTNAEYPDTIEIDSSMKIPDCQYDGGLSLVVYPNPTSDHVFVKVRGMKEPATDLEFVVFDHQFRQVGKHPYSTEGQNVVPVDGLQTGIYYLFAITRRGKILCEKFCVVGR